MPRPPPPECSYALNCIPYKDVEILTLNTCVYDLVWVIKYEEGIRMDLIPI